MKKPRLLLLLLFTGLIFTGIYFEEAGATMMNAVTLCLSCMGVG